MRGAGPAVRRRHAGQPVAGRHIPRRMVASFRPGHYGYNVSVPHSTERTFVEPMPANLGAIFTIAVNPTAALTSITATGA